MHKRESATLWRENHHSSTGFSKSSIDTETSYQMLEVFIIILRSGEVFTSWSTSITVLTFLVEKGKLVVGAYI